MKRCFSRPSVAFTLSFWRSLLALVFAAICGLTAVWTHSLANGFSTTGSIFAQTTNRSTDAAPAEGTTAVVSRSSSGGNGALTADADSVIVSGSLSGSIHRGFPSFHL